MKKAHNFILNCILFLASCSVHGQSLPTLQDYSLGKFYKQYWYQLGEEHHNPKALRRMRINAPETGLGKFRDRIEAKENGLVIIPLEEDLVNLESAFLYAEVWGGHPGTLNKRFSLNARNIYELPNVGTEHENCTYNYPLVPLKITDLINGLNALQFTCDQGNTFWGHFLVDNACLKVGLKKDHPDLVKMNLVDFNAEVMVIPLKGKNEEGFELFLESNFPKKIAKVDFLGFYKGYDENGNTEWKDWHGFTKAKAYEGHIGSITGAGKLKWSTKMLIAQEDVAVRAVVTFKGNSKLSFETKATLIDIPMRKNEFVSVIKSENVPSPFWSRAGNLKTCTLKLETDPKNIQEAELHVVIWDGGAGEVKEYFKLNNSFLPILDGKSSHDLFYRILKIDPSQLKKGENKIELLSDTHHHGIEIILPGPALVIRGKRNN